MESVGLQIPGTRKSKDSSDIRTTSPVRGLMQPSQRISTNKNSRISSHRQRSKSSAVVARDVRFLKSRAVTVLTRDRLRRSKSETSAVAANNVIARESCPVTFLTGCARVSLTGNFLHCNVFSHVPLLVIVV